MDRLNLCKRIYLEDIINLAIIFSPDNNFNFLLRTKICRYKNILSPTKIWTLSLSIHNYSKWLEELEVILKNTGKTAVFFSNIKYIITKIRFYWENVWALSLLLKVIYNRLTFLRNGCLVKSDTLDSKNFCINKSAWSLDRGWIFEQKNAILTHPDMYLHCTIFVQHISDQQIVDSVLYQKCMMWFRRNVTKTDTLFPDCKHCSLETSEFLQIF